MKFYVKQKILTFKDHFSIVDEKGHDCFKVEEKLFTWGKTLNIYNMDKRLVLTIKEKIISLLPKYYILKDKKEIAKISKEITMLRPKYKVSGLNWEVKGNFTAHEYEITKEKEVIALINKKWISVSDTYVVDVKNSFDNIYAIAVALVIDCIIEKSIQEEKKDK